MTDGEYEQAYKDLVGLLGECIDGCSKSADRGDVAAARDMDVWDNVELVVGMVADAHDVERVRDL